MPPSSKYPFQEKNKEIKTIYKHYTYLKKTKNLYIHVYESVIFKV